MGRQSQNNSNQKRAANEALRVRLSPEQRSFVEKEIARSNLSASAYVSQVMSQYIAQKQEETAGAPRIDIGELWRYLDNNEDDRKIIIKVMRRFKEFVIEDITR